MQPMAWYSQCMRGSQVVVSLLPQLLLASAGSYIKARCLHRLCAALSPPIVPTKRLVNDTRRSAWHQPESRAKAACRQPILQPRHTGHVDGSICGLLQAARAGREQLRSGDDVVEPRRSAESCRQARGGRDRMPTMSRHSGAPAGLPAH